MKVRIEKLVYGGKGIGHLDDGRVVFVPKSVPGDEVELNDIRTKRSYSESSIKSIIKPSDDRIKVRCPYFDNCGGCDHQNISYKNQLKFKDEIIQDFIDRGKIRVKERRPIIPGSDDEYYYRNSIRFEFKDTCDGLKIARHNYLDPNKPVVTESCLLQSEFSNSFFNKLLDLYNGFKYRGDELWQVKMREGKQTGEFMFEIITTGNLLPYKAELILLIKKYPEIKSAYHTVAPNKDVYKLSRRLIAGRPIIYEKIGQFTFQISPESFFQTNSLGVKTLYDTIKSFADIKVGERILDLYCGTGSIGIYLSTLAKEVTGLEIVPEAIRDAKDNAKINNIHNINFRCSDAGDLNNLTIKQFSNSVTIVDPPRAGLTKDLIFKLSTTNPRLIYVSCDPATFFRDVKLLTNQGFNFIKLQPIDMFPQTHHIELVSLLMK